MKFNYKNNVYELPKFIESARILDTQMTGDAKTDAKFLADMYNAVRAEAANSNASDAHEKAGIIFKYLSGCSTVLNYVFAHTYIWEFLQTVPDEEFKSYFNDCENFEMLTDAHTSYTNAAVATHIDGEQDVVDEYLLRHFEVAIKCRNHANVSEAIAHTTNAVKYITDKPDAICFLHMLFAEFYIRARWSIMISTQVTDLTNREESLYVDVSLLVVHLLGIIRHMQSLKGTNAAFDIINNDNNKESYLEFLSHHPSYNEDSMPLPDMRVILDIMINVNNMMKEGD